MVAVPPLQIDAPVVVGATGLGNAFTWKLSTRQVGLAKLKAPLVAVIRIVSDVDGLSAPTGSVAVTPV